MKTACLSPSHRKDGAQGRNRTTDTRIFSPLLYQLSYLGIVAEADRPPLRHLVRGVFGAPSKARGL